MLGAAIRLGEALAGNDPGQQRDHESDGILASRLDVIEGRLTRLEGEDHPAAAEESPVMRSAVELQTAEIETKLETPGEIGLRLRGELQSWLESSVSTRMTDLESRLKAESERTQKQILDALVEVVQARVMHRIGKLEDELASQSAAMTELRECSIRTEVSMQKLLGGLDRLIVAQQPTPADTEKVRQFDTTGQEQSGNSNPVPGDSGGKATSEAEPPVESTSETESQPVVELLPRSRRWAIFG